MIRGKNWYRTLKNDKQTGLLDKLHVLPKDLIVCLNIKPNDLEKFVKFKNGNEQRNIIRLYTNFRSVEEFFHYQSSNNNFPQDLKCFYEVIDGARYQKPHFDVDIDINQLQTTYNINNEDVNQVTDNIISTLILSCIDIYDRINIQRDVLIFTSHGDRKKSYHVIIDNYCHENNIQAKEFYRRVMKMFGIKTHDRYKEFIDPKVYSKTQQFRMCGSHKMDAIDRTKLFKGKFTVDNVDYTNKECVSIRIGDEYEYKLRILKNSLISYCENCEEMPKYEVEIGENCKSGIPDDEEFVGHCMDEMYKKLGCEENTFAFVNVTDNIIILKRNKPSYCELCNRIHESQNPFLSVRDGKIYWYCRRSDGKGLLVGRKPFYCPGEEEPEQDLSFEEEEEEEEEVKNTIKNKMDKMINGPKITMSKRVAPVSSFKIEKIKDHDRYYKNKCKAKYEGKFLSEIKKECQL